MDPVVVATLGAAIALAAPIIGMIAPLRRDFGQRLDGIDSMGAGLRAVEQGLPEAKGKLSFVETYILRRNEPAGGEAPAGSCRYCVY